MKKPTEICITIDTEFSIAGHFNNAEKYQPLSTPVVTCPVNGEEQGLGFLLDTFDKYQIDASFFVECANYFYFGDEPMQSLVRRIQQAGQDVQLHIHPVWLSFIKEAQLGVFPRNDNCANRTFNELFQAFKLCIEIFERWTGHQPLAIRTGSLWADLNVYKVMEKLAIPMASNIGMGVFKPESPQLHLDSGRHLIHNVMEMPIFTYQDDNLGGREHKKSLQITSCSWPEMKKILYKARAENIESLIILTHPFEFIKKADFQYKKVTKNRVNQNRLIKLCQFVNEHDQDFVSTTFTQSHQDWCESELTQPFLKIPTYYSVGRKIHNKINDLIWTY